MLLMLVTIVAVLAVMALCGLASEMVAVWKETHNGN